MMSCVVCKHSISQQLFTVFVLISISFPSSRKSQTHHSNTRSNILLLWKFLINQLTYFINIEHVLSNTSSRIMSAEKICQSRCKTVDENPLQRKNVNAYHVAIQEYSHFPSTVVLQPYEISTAQKKLNQSVEKMSSF